MPLITLSYGASKGLKNLVVRTRKAVHLRRAQALLWLEAGEPVPAIATRRLCACRYQCSWVVSSNQRALEHDAAIERGDRVP
jgi:hypothetical protein